MHFPNISDIRECSCRAFPDRVTNQESSIRIQRHARHVGSVTFSGKNVCGGICSETVNFSFIPVGGYDRRFWPWYLGLLYSGIIFGRTQFGSMGSAPIASPNDGHIYCCGPGKYIPLQAVNGELDLDVSLFGTAPDPGPPPVSGAFLFSCNNECFNEFAPRIGASQEYAVT
jgi:hypothetical protein